MRSSDDPTAPVLAIAEGAEPALCEIAEQLDRYGWATEVLDRRWHLIAVSAELLTMYGEHDAERIGVGEHSLVWLTNAVEQGWITEESAELWLRINGAFLLDATEGGWQALAQFDDRWTQILKDQVPRSAPAVWTSTSNFSRGEFFGQVNYVGKRVHGPDGEHLGYLFIYNLDMPASTAVLLMRGDRAMHERMAALVRPGRRAAVILFADLESSGNLSRRLSSPAYFALIRDIRSAMDAAVAQRGGLVGTHAGDGVSAFFLPEQLETDSRALRAALETARSVPHLVHEAAAKLANEGVPVEPADCRMKVGVHWGPGLYIGQVASQGRLEVTALGDEVNEAARIEQSAIGGKVLASKTVVEHLNTDDASALGLDPARVAYQALGDLEVTSEKAKNDAGWVPVTDISHRVP
jgi:class 3 adenylate cyclase